MMNRCLAWSISVVLDAGDLDAIDRADINNSARIAGTRSFFEERRQVSCQEEQRFHVGIHYLVEPGFRILGKRSAPRGPSVVHENVQALLSCRQLARKPSAPFSGRHIGRNRIASADSRQLFSNTIADFLLAGRN